MISTNFPEKFSFFFFFSFKLNCNTAEAEADLLSFFQRGVTVLQLLLRRVTAKIGWPAVNQRQARAKGGLELQMDKASRQCTDRPPGLGAARGTGNRERTKKKGRGCGRGLRL